MADIRALKTLGYSDQAAAVQKLGFLLYTKRASIGQAKHVRVRARFNQWEVRGRIETFGNLITEEKLNQLFEIAGNKCGFLDWRPNAKKAPGPFGQFDHKLARVA